MQADISRIGATMVAKNANPNPRAIVIALIDGAPGASKDDVFKSFREALADDADLQRAVDWYFFINMYEYHTTNRNVKQPARAPRAPWTAPAPAEVDAFKDHIVAVMLSNLVLPTSGKLLKAATFAECAKAGGWFTKVAKKGKPNQIVGKVLTEEQLRAIK